MGAGKSRGARSIDGIYSSNQTDIGDLRKLGRDLRRDMAGAACKMGNGLAGMLSTTKCIQLLIHDLKKAVAADQSQVEGFFFFFGYHVHLSPFVAISETEFLGLQACT